MDDASVLEREKHKDFFDKHLRKFEQKKLLTKEDDKIGIVKVNEKSIEVDEKV